MNAPVLAEPEAALVAAPWRSAILPLGIGLLLLGAIFSPEIAAALHTWDVSTAYNHCFLVVPIVAYLLWDRRDSLAGVRPQPFPAAALLGVPVALVWLLAERLGIMEGRQLAAVSFVEVLFLAVLGLRLWWAMCGPLLYLYFLVPFGEFLTPRLQDITAFFIRHGLTILGVPAYIDGYTIEIPQGTFFVAEACAGLRFLIASIAFGCLYALLMYRSPLRRGAFILVSLVVPIFANGLRALGIVYLGYLLNSTQAAAADHIIYGWVFFSLVILMLIGLGLPFRQDHLPARPGGRALFSTPETSTRLPLMAAAALAVPLIAVIAPAITAALSASTVQAAKTPAVIDFGPGCTVQAGPPAGAVRTVRVDCGATPMDVTWEEFSPHSTAAPVMAARRQLTIRAQTETLSEHWLPPAGATPSAWRIMTSGDPIYLAAVAVWIDGEPVRPGLGMRVRMALDSLLGTAHRPVVIVVTPAVAWEILAMDGRAKAASDLQSFLRGHPDLADRIGTVSERH